MIKLKNLVAVATMTLATSVFAVEKTIDVLAHHSKGGNGWNRTQAVISGLETLGWKVNFVPLGNCVNMLNRAKDGEPGVFFNSDASISEQSLKGCAMMPEPDQFVGVLYSRRNAICGPKGATVEQFKKRLNSGEKVTVSSSTFYPEKIIKSISDNFVHVPYQKSSKATAGMLAGDAEFMFTGMTAGVLKNDQLSCFAHGSNTKIDGMEKFTDVLPNFPYADLKVNYFLSGFNLSPELRDTLASDLPAMLELPEWKDYITSAYMIPASELNMQVADFEKSVENWKP